MNAEPQFKPAKQPVLSRISWLPVVAMGAMSVISYLDRTTLAILAPTILREVHLSSEQYGWIVSAFSVAYMAGNLFWGYLIDRFGIRATVFVAVLLWTIASASHASVATFLGFAVARVLLGFGEGATFPGGLRTVHETLPEESRGTGISIAYAGASAGAIITPLIVTPIALRFGWRAAFIFTGVIGVAWLLWWSKIACRLGSGRTRRITDEAGDRRASEVFDSRILAFVSLYAFGALPLAFGTYAAPLYLSKALGLSQALIGKLVWLPPLGWEVGYVLAGQLFDRRLKTVNGISSIWIKLVALSFLLLGLPLAFTSRAPSLSWALLMITLPMITTGGLVIIALRYGTLTFPGRPGLIAGVGAASWSSVVALVMPLIGRYFDQNQYSSAFQLVAAFPIAGFIGWLLLGFGMQKNRPSG